MVLAPSRADDEAIGRVDVAMGVASKPDFLEALRSSQVLDQTQFEELTFLQRRFPDPRQLVQELLRRQWLTAFQVNQLLLGRGKELVLGPYSLLERLGEGGMGQVYKARQRPLGRIVALKVIRRECLGNPKAIARFQREIRLAGQVCHPNIVRAYDADQIDGTYVIVLEYIDGVDLARLVKQRGPLPVRDACDYIRQAALGLQHAYQRGLVHRDIKPSNLLVTHPVRWESEPAAGTVKILDLGLARWHDSGTEVTQLTQIGTVIGTPEFIAPEQARNSHTSDIRADLYSLGCTFYFLLAGQAPFPQGSLTEKLLAHQFDEPAPLAQVRQARLAARGNDTRKPAAATEDRDVPAELCAVVLRLMAKRPQDRIQAPGELANLLADFLERFDRGLVSAACHRPVSENAATVVTLSVDAGVNGQASSQPAAAVSGPAAPIISWPRRGRPPADTLSANISAYIDWARKRPKRSVAVILGALVFGILLAGFSREAQNTSSQTAPARLSPEEEQWKQLVQKSQNKKTNLADVRRELAQFRTRFFHTPLAHEANLLLAKLPSPLDEADAANIPVKQRFPWQPAELVEVLGEWGGFAKAMLAVAISPDGRWVLCGGSDRTIRIWDALQPAAPQKLPAHSGRVLRLAVSPDCRTFASASDDGTVKLWDLATRDPLATFDHQRRPVTSIVYSPDGRLLASAGFAGVVHLWDLATVAKRAEMEGQVGRVYSLAFHPDGHTIFWGGENHQVRWAGLAQASSVADNVFEGNTSLVKILAFSPDGRTLLCGGGVDGQLRLCHWNGSYLEVRQIVNEPTGESDAKPAVNDAVYSVDGKWFYTCGDDRTIKTWDAERGAPIRAWEMRWTVNNLAVAPDGRHLLSANSNGTAYVFRLARGP